MVSISVKNLSLTYPLLGSGVRKKINASWADGAGTVSRDKADKSRGVLALKNISFELKKGDKLGIVGPNGAGKSTLLRVLAGIYEPGIGDVNVEGEIATLFNIGLGLQAEATGYRDILLAGLISGKSKKEIMEKIPEIEKFSELGEYLKLPVRTYSNGMAMRLKFSAGTTFSPNILLMDEWLGAGDSKFTDKAKIRMQKIVADAGILVLASHRKALIQNECNKILWLESGEMRGFGAVDDIMPQFLESLAAKKNSTLSPALKKKNVSPAPEKKTVSSAPKKKTAAKPKPKPKKTEAATDVPSQAGLMPLAPLQPVSTVVAKSASKERARPKHRAENNAGVKKKPGRKKKTGGKKKVGKAKVASKVKTSSGSQALKTASPEAQKPRRKKRGTGKKRGPIKKVELESSLDEKTSRITRKKGGRKAKTTAKTKPALTSGTATKKSSNPKDPARKKRGSGKKKLATTNAMKKPVNKTASRKANIKASATQSKSSGSIASKAAKAKTTKTKPTKTRKPAVKKKGTRAKKTK